MYYDEALRKVRRHNMRHPSDPRFCRRPCWKPGKELTWAGHHILVNNPLIEVDLTMDDLDASDWEVERC